MSRFVVAFITLALLVPSFAWADNLTGKIVDPQGGVVPNAQVRLFDRKSGQLRTTISSSEGGYSFPGIPSGDYLLEADASNSALSASKQISVSGDSTSDLELKISTVAAEVMVTAVGTPQTIEEVAKAIDVIDAEEIEERAEISVVDAIRTMPGIRVQQQAGPGSFTTIKTRGLRNQDTAVLIDGMRFRDAASTQGDATAFLEDLTLVDTDRIEFLRGSGSSLYGSSALAGVINIGSKPGGGPTHGDFRVEGGGLGMIRSILSIGGGAGADRLTYSGGITHLNVTKGPRDGNPHRNTSTQGAAKYSFAPGVSLSGRVWYGNTYLATYESATYTAPMLANTTGPLFKAVPLPLDQLQLYERKQPFNVGNATFIPSAIDPDQRRVAWFMSGATSFQHQVSPITSYSVTYQRVNTRRNFLDDLSGPGAFERRNSRTNIKGYTDTVNAHFDQRIGNHNFVTAGYEFEKENYYSFNGFDASTNSVDLGQKSNAVFVQDQIRLADGQLHITVAGRIQKFNLETPTFTGFSSPYTGATAVEPPTAYTGDGSIAYFVRQSGTKFRAHVGNSFRAPAGYERFGGGSGFYYGDPRLAPERSVAFDAGIDQWVFENKLQLTGTYFYTNLQQTIGFLSVSQPDPFGRFSGYRSAGGGIARGFEFSGKVSPARSTNIQMSYTYTNSEFRNPTVAGSTYYDALGISDHAFTLTLSQWVANRFNVAFDMSSVSDYTFPLFGLDFSSRPFRFNGPTKADVVVRYDHPLSDRRSLEFYSKIENVFNQQAYEGGFIGPKAWAIAGIRLNY